MPLAILPFDFTPKPRWRNWQTRQLEVLVGVKSLGGSSPLLGIQFIGNHRKTRQNPCNFRGFCVLPKITFRGVSDSCCIDPLRYILRRRFQNRRFFRWIEFVFLLDTFAEALLILRVRRWDWNGVDVQVHQSRPSSPSLSRMRCRFQIWIMCVPAAIN